MLESRAQTLAAGFSLLEGPRWRDGRLYASDFYTHQVLSFGADGSFDVVCRVPGQPSGLGWTVDGDLLVVSMTDARLLRLHQGELDEVAALKPFVTGPANDMVVDSHGRAFIGNFGLEADGSVSPTSIVRVEPNGATDIAADGLYFPNGMALADGEQTLLVAETLASRITAFDVSSEGELSNRREWARFDDCRANDFDFAIAELAVLPDGIALDEEGALWVADAKGSGVIRVLPGGDVLDRIDTGRLSVYACALGGDDGHTLFMCCSPPVGTSDPERSRRSALLAADVAVPAVIPR